MVTSVEDNVIPKVLLEEFFDTTANPLGAVVVPVDVTVAVVVFGQTLGVATQAGTEMRVFAKI